MENEAQQAPTQSKSNMMPIAIVVAVIVIIAVAAIAYGMNSNKTATTPTSTTTTTEQPAPTTAVDGTSTMAESEYNDGTYEAVGDYTSPGGAETIDVSLTLKDGVVEDAEVVSNATRPISKQMQEAFIGGFKEQVIGKKIDEISLSKVSGSSLAPKGFNDAVEKIKEEAKA